MSTKIIFRVDAYAEIGTGHLMRCLALANACGEAGFLTCFIGRIDEVILLDRIKKGGHNFISFNEKNESDWLKVINGPIAWVVLDGYVFNVQDHRYIRNSGLRLLVIDDAAALDVYDADIILNQNIYADECYYSSAYPSRLLMGPRFALLRSEFLGSRQGTINKPVANHLVVTLGGSDSNGAATLILMALSKITDLRLEIIIVAGSSDEHFDRLMADAHLAGLAGHSIEIRHYVNNMADLMKWAEFAIIAGGSTSLEVAHMGLPSLLLILAENQIPVAEAMHSAGIAKSLGWHQLLTADFLASEIKAIAMDSICREKMAAKGRALVDGLGAKRVIKEMLGALV